MGLYMYGYGWVERRLFMHVEGSLLFSDTKKPGMEHSIPGRALQADAVSPSGRGGEVLAD